MTGRPVPPPADSADPGVAWHYGDPLREQRALAQGAAAVDLSDRGVVTVTGADRLSWLHSLTTQHLEALAPGASSLALILTPNGHVEHELHLIDDGATTWIITQPGTAPALAEYLRSMQFMLRVEVDDRSDEFAVVWEPVRGPAADVPIWLVPADYAGAGHVDAGTDRGGDAARYVPQRPATLVGREVIVPRAELEDRLDRWPDRAGTWALEALRTAAAVPRLGRETDHRTLPHEVGWIGPGVHLAKGCYRGQEAVARVHNLGHPPRRLVLLHLDGSEEELPAHGDTVVVGGKAVGWIATPAWHYEEGPIATAVVKRSTDDDAVMTVTTASGEVPASCASVVTG